MGEPSDPIAISFWRIEPCGSIQFWHCSLCPDTTVVVVEGDPENATRLVEHQLACTGIPRDVASEVATRARRSWRGFPRRPHL